MLTAKKILYDNSSKGKTTHCTLKNVSLKYFTKFFSVFFPLIRWGQGALVVSFPATWSTLMLFVSHSLNDCQTILNCFWAKILTFSVIILYEMLTKNLPIEFWLFHCKFLKCHLPILLATIIVKSLYYGVTVSNRVILNHLCGIRTCHHKISKLYTVFGITFATFLIYRNESNLELKLSSFRPQKRIFY